MIWRYFDCEEHAKPWVVGGRIPIRKASSYLSEKRSGILTTDEVRQLQVSCDSIETAQVCSPLAETYGGRIMFDGCTVVADGDKRVVRSLISGTWQDAYLLCFSLTLSRKQMTRMGKQLAVRLDDDALEKLVLALNEQMGCQARGERVNYTRGYDRAHDLKGMEDVWQTEFRLFWVDCARDVRTVELPAGLGSIVEAGTIPPASEPPDDPTMYDRTMAVMGTPREPLNVWEYLMLPREACGRILHF